MADALDCPRCSTSLNVWKDFRGIVAGCDTCGGIWAEVKTLKAATLRPEAKNHQTRTSIERTPDLDEPVDCPRCGQTMERELRGAVVLDRCRAHGHWFDADEIAALATELEIEAQEASASAVVDDRPYAITKDNVDEVQAHANRQKLANDSMVET